MPSPYDPINLDPGLALGTAMIPSTPPMAYVPCRGEPGFSDGKNFLPLEPFCSVIHAEDIPVINTAQSIARASPWIDQIDATVATPCIAPYDWSLTAASRTMILDTTPDEIATPAEKAVPGYVPNPGLRFASKTHAEFDLTKFDDDLGVAYIFKHSPDCAAGSFVVGAQYAVTFVGTTDFYAIGASEIFRMATAFKATGLYRIAFVGTTDFTLIGSPNNTVGTVFVATGPGTGTGYGYARSEVGMTFTATGVGTGTGRAAVTVVADADRAHPLLRTGQTRYGFLSVAKVGTEWNGKATLPQVNPVNGVVNVCAYHYGMLLSTNASYPVLVKIGKAKAAWNKSAKTLILSSDTAGVAFKYSIDGTTPTLDYSTPVSVPATATVRWYALNPLMVSSDEWQTAITYDGATAPDDFETFYFSTLPSIGALENTYVNAALQFQRRADWYVSSAGTGDGLTPATTANAVSIIGTFGTAGKAYGARSIAASKSGTANLQLSRGGANPSGSLMKYSENGKTFSAYSSAVTPASPGRIWMKLVRADASDFTRRFMQPWFIGTGTGVQINAVWDLSEQTVTLKYESPQTQTAGAFVVGTYLTIEFLGDTDWAAIGFVGTPVVGGSFYATGIGSGTGRASLLQAGDISLLYSVDGTAPTLPYTMPIVLGQDIVAATDCEAGKKYKIAVVGDTDFTLIGSANNNVGTIFTATGAGLGTGTTTAADDVVVKTKAIHAATEPHDFATGTAAYTLTTIDPNATPDYDEDHAATWTADATIPTNTHTQNGDLIWCSEGVYNVPSTGVMSVEGIIVRGGYNADFTERDVANRKTVFKITTTSYSGYLYLGGGTADGVWADIASGILPATFLIGATTLYNCRVALSYTFPASAGALNLTNGACINCHFDVAVTAPNGADGTSGSPAGGDSYATLNVSGGTNCDYSFTVTAGNGGKGFDQPASFIGGAGGNSYVRFIMVGALDRCDCTIVATTGNGGDGGTGQTVGGSAGESAPTVSVGLASNGSIVNIDVTGGSSGNGGSGGAAGGYGGSVSGVITSPCGSDSSVTVEAVTGDAGDGGLDGLGNQRHGGAASCLVTAYISGHKPVVSASASTGNVGVVATVPCSYARVFTGGASFLPKVTASAAQGVSWGTGPTFLKAADVTLSPDEFPAINDLAGGIYILRFGPWYSGDATTAGVRGGDGAPLPGYATPGTGPGGTGTQLGRYWE